MIFSSRAWMRATPTGKSQICTFILLAAFEAMISTARDFVICQRRYARHTTSISRITNAIRAPQPSAMGKRLRESSFSKDVRKKRHDCGTQQDVHAQPNVGFSCGLFDAWQERGLSTAPRAVVSRLGRAQWSSSLSKRIISTTGPSEAVDATGNGSVVHSRRTSALNDSNADASGRVDSDRW